MIYSSTTIKRHIWQHGLVNNIDSHPEKWIEGGALDLRIGALYIMSEQTSQIRCATRRTPNIQPAPSVKKGEMKEWWVYPGRNYLWTTIETFKMPANLVGILATKTTPIRCGLDILYGQIAPGYQGILTMGLFVLPGGQTIIERGARLASVRFEQCEYEAELYNGQWQGGKVSSNGQEVRAY